MAHSRPLLVFLVLAVAALAAFPMFGDEFYQELVITLMIMGIFAMSLDLLIGFTGLVSFGHAAFFGLSGYLLAIVTPESGPVSIWFALPVCLLGSALAALVIGWFSVRTTGIYFIMITLHKCVIAPISFTVDVQGLYLFLLFTMYTSTPTMSIGV